MLAEQQTAVGTDNTVLQCFRFVYFVFTEQFRSRSFRKCQQRKRFIKPGLLSLICQNKKFSNSGHNSAIQRRYLLSFGEFRVSEGMFAELGDPERKD